MTNEKIIEQLRSLIDEAKTHFTDDGDDLIFRDDAAALIMAIRAIERLTPKSLQSAAAAFTVYAQTAADWFYSSSSPTVISKYGTANGVDKL